MSEVAERIYRLNEDEYVEFHLPDDTIECTLRDGELRGDETSGEWRWIAEEPSGDEFVLVRIPFSDGEMVRAEVYVVDGPDEEIHADDARRVTDVEVLD